MDMDHVFVVGLTYISYHNFYAGTSNFPPEDESKVKDYQNLYASMLNCWHFFNEIGSSHKSTFVVWICTTFFSGQEPAPHKFGVGGGGACLLNLGRAFFWPVPPSSPICLSVSSVNIPSLLLKYRNLDHVPPGPPGLPLIGNIHQLARVKCAMHLYFWQLSKKYGALIHMKLGPKQVIVVSSARLAKQVMKTQDLAFCSRPQQLSQQVLSYNHTDIIFSPYNEYWREVRKIAVVNLFSLKKFHSFRPVREDEVSRLVAKISSFASSGRVVNLSEMATALGSALICRIAFGKRYDEHGTEMRRFDGLFHELQDLGARVYASDYFPRLGYWVDNLNGSLGRVDAVFKSLDAFLQELIDDKSLVRTKKVDREEDDILDVLIQLKQHKAPCSVDLTWDNVKAVLFDIFAAGTDTSAVAIVWTMTALIKAPHVMQKVQAELRNMIGNKGRVDEDDLPGLEYLKAVINETFRLYPPVPLLIPRETIERCTLDGYEIQPGTLVFVNAWAIARDPEYWENSPHEFLPERFLNSDIDINGQDFGVIPFGSGRRACPGMLMGLANVELAIANLLYSFDWELPDGIQAKDVDTEALPGLALHKKNPLLLVPSALTLRFLLINLG